MFGCIPDGMQDGRRHCVSTERLIPNGMRYKEPADVLKTLICFLFSIPK